MRINEQLIKTFSPTGKLRASINLGNPILVKQKPETGEPFGVSIDLKLNDLFPVGFLEALANNIMSISQ